MSGLAGIFCLDGRPVDRPALERMAEAAPHLGPDGISLSLSGPIGLLHFQSVTTPEAVGEVQPLSAADAGWTLVFDGRLDNRDDLRSSLPASHRPLVNAPDSAFLLAAFAVWGEECPQKLVGDFAFALWQSRERRLFCARSLKGFCPFVWWSDGRTFLFASEVRQIFAGGGMARRLNEGFIGEILACAPTSVTDTPWEGISHLPPGQAMTVETQGMRKWRWHQGPFPEIRHKDDRDYEAHFRHLLGQALQSSLRSVGPVAMDLSGGLDSSSLVCLAAEGQKSGVAQPSILPFSLVFPGEPQDESGWIDLVAAHTGLEPVRVQPPSYEWDFWRATTRASMELAFRPNMASRRALLAEMQTRGCGVVVSGGGGDDWLRGSHAHWPDLVRSGQWPELWHQARASETVPLSVLGALRRFVGAGVLPLVSRRNQERLLYGRAEGVVPPWIAPGWARAICLADRIRGAERLPALSGLGQRWLYEPNLLRASFLQSAVRRLHAVYRMEQRNPLHDLRLIEFILGVPGNQFRRQGRKNLKYVRPSFSLRAEGDFPEWHGPPDRAYLVCTTYQSGSNLLAEALLDLGGFGCPLEYFDKGMRASLEARWATAGTADYLASLYRFRTDPTGALGVKLDWPHTVSLLAEQDPEQAPRVGSAGATPDEEERTLGAVWHMFHETFPYPRFIHLTRQDKVRQAVSWVRARQTRRFWGIPNAALPTDAEAHYDYDHILRTIAVFTYSEQCMNRLFAWAGVEPVRVVYEKFVADYVGTVRHVAEQLDGRTDISIRPPRLQRQSDDASEQWVKQFLQEHQEREGAATHAAGSAR